MRPSLDSRQALRLGAALLLSAVCLSSQEADPALDALKKEAGQLHKSAEGKVENSGSFRNALLNWIESRLPADKAVLDADFLGLEWRLGQELEAAELRGYGHEYAGEFELTRPAHYSEGLLLTTEGKSYLYSYGGQSRVRVLATEGGIAISPADEREDHLLLVTQEQRPRYRFDLYRLSGATVQHVLGSNPLVAADTNPDVELQASEILIEYTGDAGDLTLPDRTHVLRYRIGGQNAVRIDPVAYSSEDFVDEWLIAPWTEMESRSLAANSDRLAEWHRLWAGKSGIGTLQTCTEKAGAKKAARLQVSVRISEKVHYFLVGQTAPHEFVMEEIGDSPFEGCTGQARPPSTDPRTQRLVTEASRFNSTDPDINESVEASTPVVDALREWIESRLPANRQDLEAGFPGLQWQMRSELDRARLPATSEAHPAGGIGISLERFPEYPDGLALTTNITVPCGTDSTFYLYRFFSSGWARVLTNRGDDKWGSDVASVQFSQPDAQGDPLLLVLRHPVHCASVWSSLGYSLYRVAGASATQILSQWHGWNIGYSYAIDLQPEQLVIELEDMGLEAGMTRRHIVRYKLGANNVERIDPVAFSPSDFVQEWLTHPWEEMEWRSLEANRPLLKQWHATIPDSNGVIFGEPGQLAKCSESPGYWQFNASLQFKGPKREEDETVYFLVQERGRHLFTMVNISQNSFKGCPEPDQ